MTKPKTTEPNTTEPNTTGPDGEGPQSGSGRPASMSRTAPLLMRRLVREARFGGLATLDKSGAPYVSLVAIATDWEGRPTLLVSKLARHTRNMAADQRVSLLISAPDAAAPMDAPRVSILGRVAPVGRDAVRDRYLARHPAAALYAGFTDFGFLRLEPDEVHLVEGFGRVIDLPGSAILTDWAGADELRAGAADAIAHMNADHADAVELFAIGLLGEQPGEWRMIALDPEGCELQLAERVRRLEFAARVSGNAALRQVLVALTQEARGVVAR